MRAVGQPAERQRIHDRIDSLLYIVFGTHATLAQLLSTIETRADVDLVIEAVDK
jgi:hypothetical protein